MVILETVSPSMDRVFGVRGRRRKIDCHADRLVLLMIYYRAYVTHEFLGYFVGLDDSNICRLFKVLEPVVVDHVHIKKDRTLTEDAVSSLLVDATEQPIQRPVNRKARKHYYSGKKKRHTHKTEIIMTSEGKIVGVSKSVAGSVHDMTLRKSSDPLPPNVDKYLDLGYLGLQRDSPKVHLPHKKPKGKRLDSEKKEENRRHSRIRVAIEHKFAQIKKFRILADVYRNFRKKHHMRFNLIAGIINLQCGF